jgi:hypothetical protein
VVVSTSTWWEISNRWGVKTSSGIGNLDASDIEKVVLGKLERKANLANSGFGTKPVGGLENKSMAVALKGVEEEEETTGLNPLLRATKVFKVSKTEGLTVLGLLSRLEEDFNLRLWGWPSNTLGTLDPIGSVLEVEGMGSGLVKGKGSALEDVEGVGSTLAGTWSSGIEGSLTRG